jgi:TolB-like protein/class 3 adenylate cyclase/tetratricopeptide (TPR) repeat protein
VEAKRVQRRLAAILAADVAGYSRLTGADEEGTIARLRALRRELIDPTIASHGGRIVKTTGDGILIEFASVVDAVRCAVEVQRGMASRNSDVAQDKRIEFRVGINLGDVVVEGDDLLGDGVNVAARLEGIAEPGTICLSDDAYRQIKGKIDLAVRDLGEQPLKNIAAPIRVYVLSPDSRQPTASAPVPAGHAPRLSIVVLPFANIGGDPEQEYFVDGMTESLTTDLSRIAGSMVIARNTAFTYKGRPFDVKKIGGELGARYVLEGSVQRAGNRMRLNVQLVDTESGHHLWAERFDKPVADLFDMQDEIVARLAGALSTHLVAAEARRAERAPHPDSMDLYFQGMACINNGEIPEYMLQARNFFARALALDPGNVEALVGSAYVDSVVAGHLFSKDRQERFAAAEMSLTRALSLAPNHAWAHMMLGHAYIFTNRATHGMAECQRALALDRNLAMAHACIGQAKYFTGRGEETEAHVLEALRLSPRDTNAYVWMVFAGNAKQQLGAQEEALAWYRRAVEINRNLPVTHFFLAAALALLGRLDEARSAAHAGLALDPTFTVARFRAGASSDNPVYLRQRESICEGMRRAGVPK